MKDSFLNFVKTLDYKWGYEQVSQNNISENDFPIGLK